jgi:hypothetical protein
MIGSLASPLDATLVGKSAMRPAKEKQLISTNFERGDVLYDYL